MISPSNPPKSAGCHQPRFTVVCAPDSFKGSLSAIQAADAMSEGVRDAVSNLPLSLDVRAVPLADGGDGTLEVFLEYAGASRRETYVLGPLGEPRKAPWGILKDGHTAIIEMAEAAGLTLVPPARRNPLNTSTHGVGQLIAAALAEPEVQRIIVSVGGSATCDGGIGMAQALGIRLLDRWRQPIANPAKGADLDNIQTIDASGLPARVRECEILVACDVTNPLLGPRGAAPVFAPQKGASPDDVAHLEWGLASLVGLWGDAGLASQSINALPGGGAAGGLAAGLVAFLGAKIVSGIDFVLDALHFDEALDGAGLVLTGEGALDAQSLQGKVISGVGRRCVNRKIPACVLAGSIAQAPPHAELEKAGIFGAFSIVEGPCEESKAMDEAQALLRRAAARVFRLYWMAKGAGKMSMADSASAAAASQPSLAPAAKAGA